MSKRGFKRLVLKFLRAVGPCVLNLCVFLIVLTPGFLAIWSFYHRVEKHSIPVPPTRDGQAHVKTIVEHGHEYVVAWIGVSRCGTSVVHSANCPCLKYGRFFETRGAWPFFACDGAW